MDNLILNQNIHFKINGILVLIYRGKLGNTDPEIIWTPSDFSNMKKN